MSGSATIRSAAAYRGCAAKSSPCSRASVLPTTPVWNRAPAATPQNPSSPRSPALQLDTDEQAHLRNLAHVRAEPSSQPRPERLKASVQRLLDAVGPMPACVLGRHMDVLGWNRLGHALLAGHLDIQSPTRPLDRPNMARLVFLDPHTRDLFTDWNDKAREAAAYLRLEAGRAPNDPALSRLIGELSVHSPAFTALWAKHPAQDKTHGKRRFNHPLVGSLALEYDTFRLPAGQVLITFSAERGTAAAALELLDRATTKPERHDPAPATTPVLAG